MQYKVGDRVVFKKNETDGYLAVGVFTVSNTDTHQSTQYIQLRGCNTWFTSDRFLKVPLFNVEQVVRFKDIKQDKWCTSGQMVNLEGKVGIVMEVCRDCYYADKPYEDGCQYKVKDLQKGGEWLVTSASLEPSPEMANIGTIDYYSKEDIIAATTTAERIAQAVDNVKGSQFNIGDTVVIRDDLIPGKKYEEWDYSPEDGMGGWEFAAAMAKYMGKVATITGYVADDSNYCRLDIDKGTYSWIVNSLLPYTSGSDYDIDKQSFRQINKYFPTNKQQTKQNYENRLQESDPIIAGGKERPGCAICYPGNKASIGIGHLRDSTTACKR